MEIILLVFSFHAHLANRLNLNSRTDRQDALTLLSSLSSLNISILHGVTGEETARSPVIPHDTKLRPAELGCWRSHVNSWKRVIESGVETALILEDDADWHVNIKEQMSLLSQELKKWGSPLKAEQGWGMGNRTGVEEEKGEVKEEKREVKEEKGGAAPYGTLSLYLITIRGVTLTHQNI
jgi:hypothetical protein